MRNIDDEDASCQEIRDVRQEKSLGTEFRGAVFCEDGALFLLRPLQKTKVLVWPEAEDALQLAISRGV